MEIRNLYNNIYIDPLTCLPNFFEFIESDYEEVFGEKGVILIFDIAKMMMVNQNFGRSAGDLHIKALAEVILEKFTKYDQVAVFRTNGDEFTVIARDGEASDIEAACDEVKLAYTSCMKSRGFIDAKVNTLIMYYNEGIKSVEQYYEVLLKDSHDQGEKEQGKFNRENLFKNIIGGVINRVKETLSYYDNACSMAFVDDISGLPNHRAGKMLLTDLLENYKLKSKGLSLLFIDGDDLKRYNNISYETGNDMIRRLSGIIAETLRSEDKIFRWLSGDEFLIVLEEAEESKVLRVAERIRQTVEIKTKSWIHPITISIGVSNYPRDGKCITDLIEKAERANVCAKEAGKNKVFVWGETAV